jgi:hypothetical protein
MHHFVQSILPIICPFYCHSCIYFSTQMCPSQTYCMCCLAIASVCSKPNRWHTPLCLFKMSFQCPCKFSHSQPRHSLSLAQICCWYLHNFSGHNLLSCTWLAIPTVPLSNCIINWLQLFVQSELKLLAWEYKLYSLLLLTVPKVCHSF